LWDDVLPRNIVHTVKSRRRGAKMASCACGRCKIFFDCTTIGICIMGIALV
jgi:hypothetical protein